MPFNYGYNYAPPMQDQLSQLRNNPMPMQQPGMYQGQQPYQPQPVQQPVMQQPVMQQPAMQQPAQQPQQPAISGPIYVNGDAGARGFIVAPNKTVMLIDADPEAQTFWLKSADAAGMPSMRTFDYSERNAAQKAQAAQSSQPVDYVTHKELDALAANINSIAAEVEQLKAKRVVSTKKAVKEASDDE